MSKPSADIWKADTDWIKQADVVIAEAISSALTLEYNCHIRTARVGVSDMAKHIKHFIFVPGLGAGMRHPVGRGITEAIQRETAGTVSVHFAKVCDEVGNVIVAHSIERQAEALARQIKQLKGEAVLFAHSQAGIPTAMALARTDFAHLSPANVFLAGTPLDSQLSRQRTEMRALHDSALIRLVRAKVPMVRNVACVKRQPRDMALPAARYVAITQEHLASYPPTEEHLTNLRALGACTLIVSGNEEITDCTPSNIMAKLPGRRNATRPETLGSHTIVLKGADHSLTELCEKEVPAIILKRVDISPGCPDGPNVPYLD